MSTPNDHAPDPNAWVMFQRWEELLFTHWRVAPDQIQPHLPRGVTVDEFDGSAWLGAVAFRMGDIEWRANRGLPGLLRLLTTAMGKLPGAPNLHRFPELNLRTYVQGPRGPAVAFLSIDAPSRYNVFMARRIFGLPFYYATVDLDASGSRTQFQARRRGSPAEYAVSYAGAGAATAPAEGSLERFLVERYAQYAKGPFGKLIYAQLTHEPWMVQAAQAEITKNTVLDVVGVDPQSEPHFHYVHTMDTRFYRPELIDA